MPAINVSFKTVELFRNRRRSVASSLSVSSINQHVCLLRLNTFLNSEIQRASIAQKSMARSCVRHAGSCRFESQLSHFFVMSVLFFLIFFFKSCFFKVFFQDFTRFVTHASFYKIFNINLIYMRKGWGLG